MNVWAPGRVNLMGEHTDYSSGLVLPIAVQLGITVTFEPADRVALDAPGGERYVDAVVQELAELGRRDVGLTGTVAADLPQGAGLGSSGARARRCYSTAARSSTAGSRFPATSRSSCSTRVSSMRSSTPGTPTAAVSWKPATRAGSGTSRARTSACGRRQEHW